MLDTALLSLLASLLLMPYLLWVSSAALLGSAIGPHGDLAKITALRPVATGQD